jgi:hypothetical protein
MRRRKRREAQSFPVDMLFWNIIIARRRKRGCQDVSCFRRCVWEQQSKRGRNLSRDRVFRFRLICLKYHCRAVKGWRGGSLSANRALSLRNFHCFRAATGDGRGVQFYTIVTRVRMA